MFVKNGYHLIYIDKIRQLVKCQITTPKLQTLKPDIIYFKTPYSKHVSKVANCVFKSVNNMLPNSRKIRLVFAARKSLFLSQ